MSDNTARWKFETKQVHSGARPDPVTNARATPIYQTTSYVFNNSDHAKNLFALAEFGNIYTRIQNPTQDVVEQRVTALEGGTGALLLSSGQSAATIAMLNVAQAGERWPLYNALVIHRVGPLAPLAQIVYGLRQVSDEKVICLLLVTEK